MNAFRKSPFTLVEMLVVVAVVGLLFALALPAFNRLVQGNAITQAASAVQLTAKQAQFNAVSARRYTALLIDMEGTETNGVPALRVCLVEKPVSGGTSVEAEFESFPEGCNWVPLPAGAVIVYGDLDDPDVEKFTTSGTNHDQSKFPNHDSAISLSDLQKVKSVRKADSGTILSLPAIIFSRYGAVYNQTKAARLLIGEGVLQNSKIFYTGARDSAGKPENAAKVSINPFSGKPSLKFRY